MCYCAKVVNGVVVSVIVCTDAQWACTHLGGEWVCTGNDAAGIGWLLSDGKIVPPPGLPWKPREWPLPPAGQ